jgi:signal transduction histidine kinase
VQVKAREGDGRLNLEIHDDGVGFFEGEVRQSEGLKNMRRRAAHIGGTLAILSGAGKGTTITLSVPLVEN